MIFQLEGCGVALSYDYRSDKSFERVANHYQMVSHVEMSVRAVEADNYELLIMN